MNTDVIRPNLIGSDAVEQFARYYISSYGLDGFYPEVRKCIVGSCSVISRLARDLFIELLYSELSKIGYLDFLDFLGKRGKISLLATHGIHVINAKDDYEILCLLKNLGEEKVLKTLSTYQFILGHIAFNYGFKK